MPASSEQEGKMSQLFARVDLRGTPREDVYNRLNEYMVSKSWYTVIDGVSLPHATYQAAYRADVPNLIAIAANLRASIENTIWTGAHVLVIRVADWAQSAG
jgi:hypothetical protein